MLIEPVSAALGAASAAKSLLGGVTDRWRSTKLAQLDEKALNRLLLLEFRRNQAILDVAVGKAEPISTQALWLVPVVLQTEALEAVLGSGAPAAGSFKSLQRLGLVEPPDSSSGVLANIYVRITALQGLAAVNSQAALSRVKIRLRLSRLRDDCRNIVSVLAKWPSIRIPAKK